ncbi:MAG: sigma-70 family RNA polymerase sigma factor [Lentimicrobiaceae bacterium]|nr:sigma-70 family RNA polymerase sigma factor [Lentimicrobiaceae bacterium]
MTDKQYISAIHNGDQRAFANLYEMHRGRFFGYIRKIYNKDDDYIADLYQDSCVVFWQNIQKGKIAPETMTSSIETYLIGVAKYTLMARDRRYKEILSDCELSTFAPVIDEEALRNEIERSEVVQSVVNKMEEPCSTLLDKFYWEELSGEEIATQMNYKNTDTVKTQKYKCMQKLKIVLTSTLKNLNLL